MARRARCRPVTQIHRCEYVSPASEHYSNDSSFRWVQRVVRFSSMKKPLFLCVVLHVLMIAGAAHAQSRSLPTFEVDRSWPKVPAQWKLGDPSSIAIDAKDNVWVLHRPRTLKPEDKSKAAPPVVVFDTAGTYVKAWGGAGNGYEWPEREHGIHIENKGFVWLGGNNCPSNGLAGLKPV